MELTHVEQWLWFGFVGLGVGSLVITYLMYTLQPRNRFHALIALIVTVIATISYYALARGQADITVSGHVVYFGRYLDWLFTTPLLLLSLILVALPPLKNIAESRQRLGLIASVLAADVFMIVTGFFADLSSQPFDRTIWYTASCLWFLVILWMMFGDIKDQAVAYGKRSGELYTRLLTFLSVAWILYPVVWVLGTSGTNMVSLTTETALYATLDVSAKAVFGILVILGVAKLEKSKER